MYRVMRTTRERNRQVDHFPVIQPLLQRPGQTLANMILVPVKNLVIGNVGRKMQPRSPGTRLDR